MNWSRVDKTSKKAVEAKMLKQSFAKLKRNQTMKRQSHDLEFLMLGKNKKKEDSSKHIQMNEDNRSTSTILLPNEKEKIERVLRDARSKSRDIGKAEKLMKTPLNKLIPKNRQLGNTSEFSFRPMVATPASSKSVIFNDQSPTVHTFSNYPVVNTVGDSDPENFPSTVQTDFNNSENENDIFVKPKKVPNNFFSPNSSIHDKNIKWKQNFPLKEIKSKEITTDDSAMDIAENLYSDSPNIIYSASNSSSGCLPKNTAGIVFDEIPKTNSSNNDFVRPKPKLGNYLQNSEEELSKLLPDLNNEITKFQQKPISNPKSSGIFQNKQALSPKKKLMGINVHGFNEEEDNDDKMSQCSYRFPPFTWSPSTCADKEDTENDINSQGELKEIDSDHRIESLKTCKIPTKKTENHNEKIVSDTSLFTKIDWSTRERGSDEMIPSKENFPNLFVSPISPGNHLESLSNQNIPDPVKLKESFDDEVIWEKFSSLIDEQVTKEEKTSETDSPTWTKKKEETIRKVSNKERVLMKFGCKTFAGGIEINYTKKTASYSPRFSNITESVTTHSENTTSQNEDIKSTDKVIEQSDNKKLENKTSHSTLTSKRGDCQFSQDSLEEFTCENELMDVFEKSDLNNCKEEIVKYSTCSTQTSPTKKLFRDIGTITLVDLDTSKGTQTDVVAAKLDKAINTENQSINSVALQTSPTLSRNIVDCASSPVKFPCTKNNSCISLDNSESTSIENNYNKHDYDMEIDSDKSLFDETTEENLELSGKNETEKENSSVSNCKISTSESKNRTTNSQTTISEKEIGKSEGVDDAKLQSSQVVPSHTNETLATVMSDDDLFCENPSRQVRHSARENISEACDIDKKAIVPSNELAMNDFNKQGESDKHKNSDKVKSAISLNENKACGQVPIVDIEAEEQSLDNQMSNRLDPATENFHFNPIDSSTQDRNLIQHKKSKTTAIENTNPDRKASDFHENLEDKDKDKQDKLLEKDIPTNISSSPKEACKEGKFRESQNSSNEISDIKLENSNTLQSDIETTNLLILKDCMDKFLLTMKSPVINKTKEENFNKIDLEVEDNSPNSEEANNHKIDMNDDPIVFLDTQDVVNLEYDNESFSGSQTAVNEVVSKFKINNPTSIIDLTNDTDVESQQSQKSLQKTPEKPKVAQSFKRKINAWKPPTKRLNLSPADNEKSIEDKDSCMEIKSPHEMLTQAFFQCLNELNDKSPGKELDTGSLTVT
ncbi:DgyrCDS3715 [Dimorphilus gyrociliatus]|uniref:DgyrCDS3715 n=1 Tax=Dimorphilus gyrociliatus TaxID=2664684 RepID=A0A7I8VES5_9ANNE|nr:DgyrCDS3715 [Dimorphilus gyrociliatus]